MDKEDKDYEEEENSGHESIGDEPQHQRKPHKGGIVIREEPSNIRELQASHMIVSCFRHLGCYEFCEKVQRVQRHPKLTRLFVANINDNKATLVGVTFIVSSSIIADATRILNVGEKWYKSQDLDEHYYEPYIKSQYRNEKRWTFPFRFLKYKYAPMMRIIMKYFTCQGRFSRFYTYHIRLIMYFTRVKMLNIPYFLFRNIEKIAYIVQEKPYPQQMSSIYHYSLIKMIVLHHLNLLNTSWDTFIANDIFNGPQIPPLVPQKAKRPSSSAKVKGIGVGIFFWGLGYRGQAEGFVNRMWE